MRFVIFPERSGIVFFNQLTRSQQVLPLIDTHRILYDPVVMDVERGVRSLSARSFKYSSCAVRAGECGRVARGWLPAAAAC